MNMKTGWICGASLFALLGCSDAQSKTPETPAPIEQTRVPQGKAKNVILFIGDGMGVSTVTAMRIFEGQQLGKTGEEHELSFERFDNVALVKTYNLDAQVPDSAGTASAMNTGLKTQVGKINVQPDGLFAGCAGNSATAPETLMDHARASGAHVGVVSTARLTHATPAAVYGHAADRGFESVNDLSDEAKAAGCKDLARQLIDADLALALGGGYVIFDPERREDGIDLVRQWENKSGAHSFARNASEFRAIPAKDSRNVLGLFTRSHLSYEADRKNDEEPSLTEMTEYAVENLSARDGGYFLMVEAGRIDHAHHGTNAYRALTDGVEFARAIDRARKMTNPEDTLILVTADHSHVFVISGYQERGNPILGLAKSTGEDGEVSYRRDKYGNPYTTLGYYNGPNDEHEDVLSEAEVTAPNYQQRTAVKLDSETHAGEDVALYADGPGAEAVRGVMDQTEIYDVILKATGWDGERAE